MIGVEEAADDDLAPAGGQDQVVADPRIFGLDDEIMAGHHDLGVAVRLDHLDPAGHIGRAGPRVPSNRNAIASPPGAVPPFPAAHLSGDVTARTPADG